MSIGIKFFATLAGHSSACQVAARFSQDVLRASLTPRSLAYHNIALHVWEVASSHEEHTALLLRNTGSFFVVCSESRTQKFAENGLVWKRVASRGAVLDGCKTGASDDGCARKQPGHEVNSRALRRRKIGSEEVLEPLLHLADELIHSGWRGCTSSLPRPRWLHQ
jgi:hypothetical protein